MTRFISLRDLQDEQAVWAAHNFPGVESSWEPFAGIVEEVGELSHALLKRKQEIRGTRFEHNVAIVDAVGDIVVYLADFCTREGFDLETAVRITWDRVKQRDWQKDKVKGGE